MFDLVTFKTGHNDRLKLKLKLGAVPGFLFYMKCLFKLVEFDECNL